MKYSTSQWMPLVLWVEEKASKFHTQQVVSYEIYSGGGPSTYIYCVVCYRVIAAAYVRSVGHVFHTFTLLMMIRNTQWTMKLLYSLKMFLVCRIHYDIDVHKVISNYLGARTYDFIHWINDQNNMQHNIPPDDPNSFISLLSLFYSVVWLGFVPVNVHICLPIPAHRFREWFKFITLLNSNMLMYYIRWSVLLLWLFS